VEVAASLRPTIQLKREPSQLIPFGLVVHAGFTVPSVADVPVRSGVHDSSVKDDVVPFDGANVFEQG